MINLLLFSAWLGPSSLGGLHGPAASRATQRQSVPKEVRDLAGTYTGSWTMFGIDGKGEVTKRMAWTDVMRAEDPSVKGDQAFVTTSDEMTFEGRGGAPFKLPGREGYYLNRDGTLGEYFLDTFGQSYRMHQLAKDVWVYATTATAPELAQLGFPKGATAQHVIVKVVTNERGVETHQISRVTTATWKDASGQERVLQFVSLRGVHRRRDPARQ